MVARTHKVEEAELTPRGVWLIARRGVAEIARVFLEPDRRGDLIVGSGPDSTLRIDDPSVSRKHVILRWRVGRLAVQDAGSTNGTKYLGGQITQALLTPPLTLVLGHVEVLIEPAVVGLKTVGGLRSVSPAFLRVLDQVERAAPTDAPVLLTGPSGVGKERVARALHLASPRAREPFEVIDCAALTPGLLTSELFGHEAGAFTGAARRHQGAFERAKKGTVLLDEVGALPIDQQPTLLRVLEQREFRRVGGAEALAMQARVIATSRTPLDEAVRAGTFREDLFHRVGVVLLEVPPLGQRLDDLPLLVRDILDELGQRAAGFHLSGERLDELRAQPWPGNVRELRNFIERAVALGHTDARSATAKFPEDFREARELAMNAFEREFVLHLLQRHGGNVSRAAEAAGIARHYLHRIVKRHGLKAAGR